MRGADEEASLADVVEVLYGIGRILQVVDGRLEVIEDLLLGEDDGED